jgi:hypothetical protein
MGERRMFMENYTLTFGKITFNSHKKPIVEVVMRNWDDEEEVVGYLTCFRDYSFQISETAAGEWDLGSSEPLFNTPEYVRQMHDNTCRRNYVKGQVMIALVNYVNSRDCKKYACGVPVSILPDMEDTFALDRYMALTLAYFGCGEVRSLIQYPSTIDLLKEMK